MDSFKKLAASFKFVKESVADAISFGDGEEYSYIGICQAGLSAESGGNLAAAEENYLAALASAELDDKDGLGACLPLNLLADFYQNQERFSESEGLYIRAIELLEKYESLTCETQKLLADQFGPDKYAQYEAMYQQFRAVTNLLHPEADNQYVRILESYAALLRKTNRNPLAEVFELRAETLRMKK